MSIVLQGSTSGSITLQEPAVAGSTVLDLPATSGTLITTGSSGQVIPKAALPTGSVLQVVNASTNVTASNSSSTYADTGLSASITPLYSTSKILVIVDQTGLQKGTSNTWLGLRLLRGSTSILEFEIQATYNGTTTVNNVGGAGCSYLDSPATTSSTTYKTQFANQNSIGTVNVQAGNNGGYSTMTLMEIAA